MTYLELCLFLEMFTIRYSKEYEKGLVVRCRRLILKEFKDLMKFSSESTHLSSEFFINGLYKYALPLDYDECLFLLRFLKYIKNLTELD